jgi:hypothetical protein
MGVLRVGGAYDVIHRLDARSLSKLASGSRAAEESRRMT